MSTERLTISLDPAQVAALRALAAANGLKTSALARMAITRFLATPVIDLAAARRAREAASA